MCNLRSQWNSFHRFCQDFLLVPLPASPSTISSYAVFLTQRTSSYQYILGHLNAVRLLHLSHGLSTDSFTCFEVSLTKRGLKRVLGAASRQKHPLTPAILLDIYHVLDMNCPSHAMIWALFLVAFFSFLRKSNLVSSTASTFDCQRDLTRRDIKFTTSGCFLHIKWSKTRQHKEGIHIVPLPSIPHSPLCPVTAIHHFFSLVPASPDDLFFCFLTATSLTPVTASLFTMTLKKLVGKLGLAPTNYSPHSFRWGGATFAFQAGAPEHLLQLHGDWRSDAYKQYLTLPLCARSSVASLWPQAFSVTIVDSTRSYGYTVSFLIRIFFQTFLFLFYHSSTRLGQLLFYFLWGATL